MANGKAKNRAASELAKLRWKGITLEERQWYAKRIRRGMSVPLDWREKLKAFGSTPKPGAGSLAKAAEPEERSDGG